MKKCKKWTTDEDNQLKILAMNHDKNEIAMSMGKSVDSVRGRLHILNIKAVRSNAYRNWEDEFLISYFSDIPTIRKAAAKLGRSVNSVAHRLKELGVCIRHRNYRKPENSGRSGGYVKFKR